MTGDSFAAVTETVPADVFAKAGGKSQQAAPVADPAELGNYDAIIFGTGTRFGNTCCCPLHG